MKTRFAQMQEQMLRHFGPEQGQRTYEALEKEYHSLCGACADLPK